jgi:pyruvate formate lyase activating enzyme
MKFGGLQKNSFIDFPGKVSCVLFLKGCNFDCPYCHNPDLIKSGADSPVPLEEGQFFDFLKDRKKMLDGVVISGGEPTLHKDLPLLCQKIKDMGFVLKLDTNGSRPKRIQEIIGKRLVDYIAMDIKTDPRQYGPCVKKDFDPTSVLASIRVIMESNLPYEFRTTCVKKIVDEEKINNISREIRGARLYALQKYHPTKILHPEFFDQTEVGFADDTMARFQSIASDWVQECIVR